MRQALPSFEPVLESVRAAGYELRPLALDRYEDELETVYELSKSIFADNLLYEPISLVDFLALYEPARSLLDPELVWFALSPGGDPVGFGFSIVDFHRAVTAMRGSRSLLAKLRFLLARGKADAVNVKSLGVVKEHRRSGVAGALIGRTYEAMLRKGFRRATLCLIRDGNPSGRLDGGKGRILRRYSLYRYRGRDVA